MNRIKRMILYSILLLSIMSFFPLMVINSKTQAGTIYSIESTAPTIDGVLGSTEWNSAIAQEITLYNMLDQTIKMNISVKSMYCTNEILYFGITINDKTTGEDELGIIFRVGPEEIMDTSIPDFRFLGGHDLKSFLTHNNLTVDGYMDDDGYGYLDTAVGGTNNMFGRCQYTANSHISVELSIPFDSSDIALANDPLITVDDSFELFFTYKNDTSDSLYSQLRVTDDDYDYTNLTIGAPPTSTLTTVTTNNLSIILTIFCLFGINIIAVFYKKKLKK